MKAQPDTPLGHPSKREPRRFQWSLRLLLLFTALCAVAVRVWLVPYWREASTARWLAEIGAGTHTAISGPEWLRAITGDRYLEHIVGINFFSDCDIRDDDLASLRWLSRLEIVSFRYAPLGDRGLEHLGRVSSLCVLDLEGTSVSDAGLRQVERLPNLRELRLRRTPGQLAAFGESGVETPRNVD